MMSLARAAFAVFTLIVLAACSSAPRISTDYDPNHNFGVIQSYHIIEKQRSTNDLTNDRITHAINQAMHSRGLVNSSAEGADVLIDFMVVTKDKTRVTSYNSGYGYYGYGYGYRGLGYDTGPNQIDVRQYTEGSLLIDLVDPAAKKTLWRGMGSAMVRERSPEEKTELINSYTDAIIEQMPLGIAK